MKKKTKKLIKALEAKIINVEERSKLTAGGFAFGFLPYPNFQI